MLGGQSRRPIAKKILESAGYVRFRAFFVIRAYLVTILKTLYPIFVGLLYSKYVLYSMPLEGHKIRRHDLPPLVGIGWTDLPSSRGGALCVQMDFMRTFEANTKCNNNKYVWSHFYQILVVLKYHRRLWNNIFDTDIFRCINTHIKGVYLAFFAIFMLLEMSVSKIFFHRRLWYFRTTEIW